MADKSADTSDTAAPVADAQQAPAPDARPDERAEAAPAASEPAAAKQSAENPENAGGPGNGDEVTRIATDDPPKKQEKPADDAAPEPEPAAAAGQTPVGKSKGSRRKSGAGESKGKSLSKKGSKARFTHVDAKPGDHFLVKLKGFPAWPAIVCDETMLPAALINSRPASAARPDGSYADAFADGGKRVHDRSFPVMYLHTNEFGWVQNTALSELSAEKAKDSLVEKMRKDLKAAFELAAEHHDVEHYKQILKSFQEEQIAQEEARKQAAATPKKSKKGKGKAAGDDDDSDTDEAVSIPRSTKSKKRKAEDDASTPQRTDSVKKPKIKLNTSTPKTANGAAVALSAGGGASKASKTKPKKAKEAGEKKAETAKEANMTSEERRARKEKEVLYLRHKLQRGLLTREQQPREDEMRAMSDYIAVLESFVDLEVTIIRSTKINKVLKAILKLESVPREDEFQFKKRSQSLLDKWNKLLAGDASGPPSATINGVNGAGEDSKSEANGARDVAAESQVNETDQAAPPKAEATAADEGPAHMLGSAEEKQDKPDAVAETAPEAVAAAD